MLYFVHNFLCAKDLSTKFSSKWVLLSADRDAFSAHPWGRVSYDLTIEYLLKAVNPNVKISNLYVFPWAFMCWTFEAIPPLRKKFKVFSEEMSSPRILRWLSATNNQSVKINELFDPPPPPKDSIVHPWISHTPSDMEINFFTRFVPLQLTKDDKIEKLERDLNGVGEIKRDCTVDEGDLDPSRAVYVGGTVVGDGGESSPNIDRGTSGVVAGGGGGSSPFVTSGLGGFSGDFGVGRSLINENVSRPQETPSTIEVPSCKLYHEKIDLLTARVDTLEKAITTMMSKRGI
ncbi:putative glycerol-3-phosphate 2-O-acyltransferase 6-like [Capsicum annuum]|nr:putative glycerol-3-phosphate 2-O-acyltransferase 6-like [Capsicum annuum]